MNEQVNLYTIIGQLYAELSRLARENDSLKKQLESPTETGSNTEVVSMKRESAPL